MSCWSRNCVVGWFLLGVLVLVVIIIATVCGDVYCSAGSAGYHQRKVVEAPSDVTDEDLLETIDSLTKAFGGSSAQLQADVLFAASQTKITFSQHGINQKSRQEDGILDKPSSVLLRLPEAFNEKKKSESCQQKGKVAFTKDNNPIIKQWCPWEKEKKPNCTNAKKKSLELSKQLNIKREYRSLDGSCNYRERPLVGMASTPFSRNGKIKDTYEYCNSNSSRNGQNNEELPSAREISNAVFHIGEQTDSKFTALLMQMGQFIDHDIAHGPLEEVTCCESDSDGKLWNFPKTFDKSMCLPIRIADDDPYWKDKKRTCIEFARTKLSPSLDCRSGRREQRNDLSHWLDLSSVYGSSEKQLAQMVDPSNEAKLKITNSSREQDLLPRCKHQDTTSHLPEICEDCLKIRPKPSVCFFAGDVRVNEQNGLTAMHTLWLREHNRIADELLSQHNVKDFKSNKARAVFQEVRRIVIAEYQHVIWNEWLPIIIGQKYMDKKKMSLQRSWLPYSSHRYRPNRFNGISNEFASAAFRFGHSLIGKHIPQKRKDGSTPQKILLHDSFFNPKPIVDDADFVDDYFRGVVEEEVPAWDPNFTEDIKNKLFFEELDLVALNIQRGRDHGIAGYTQWNKYCNTVTNINNFKDLDKLFGIKVRREKVEKIYKHVDDIDLFVGGTLEKPEAEGILGGVFRCIVANQFQRLKEGDRFWYENGESRLTMFTKPQLKQIREATFAEIICKNTNIQTIQQKVFMTDKKISCNDIPSMDLSVFGKKGGRA